MTVAATLAQMGSNNTTFRNRIINGAMVFDQRNAGASVTPTNGAYTVDRWQAALTQASKFTVQQNAGSVTPPVGFTKYLGITSSSAYSVTSTDQFYIEQPIEGLNISDLAWGSTDAKPVTLSFQVYSSLTGTFGGHISNSGYTRNYPFTFTISSANTWTSVSVTIAGDTSGTWLTTNGVGIRVGFNLGFGSNYNGTANTWTGSVLLSVAGNVSVVGTSGATFYITGVQLEAGTNATPFEYRSYGTELALCQRYFQSWGGESTYCCFAQGTAYSTTQVIANMIPQVPMRAAPTLAYTGTFGVVFNGNVVNATSTSLSGNQTSTNGFSFLMNSLSGTLPSIGYAVSIATTTTATRFQLVAEL